MIDPDTKSPSGGRGDKWAANEAPDALRPTVLVDTAVTRDKILIFHAVIADTSSNSI